MAGLLNIGLTGLNAAQIQLNTTSHNIANADTPGYSRQTVVQSTNDPLFTGVGFFGQGTRIAAVTRQYSQFLENQVLSADNRRSEFAAYSLQISQINNLLADPEAGLAPALQGFFAGVQEVASNPTSVAARQALLSNAESLAARFQAMDTRIEEVRRGVEAEIAGSVGLINNYAEQIAEMNGRILIAQSAGTAVPANDLLDQRNQLIAELNQLIKVNTVTESDGSVSVFIGSGQNLVLGQQMNRLAATPDPNDPTRLTVSLVTPGGSSLLLPEKLLTGGNLGGLLAFRRESLDPAQNRLGLIAIGMAEAFNAQHRLGQDLDGALGGDFFRIPGVTVRPAGAVEVGFAAGGLGALTGSDYRLDRLSDGTYDLVRLSDGRRFAGVSDGDTVDGLRFDALSLAIGESALIQPTRNAARDISVAITDVRRIAAGNPVTVHSPLTNQGSAVIDEIVMLSAQGAAGNPLAGPLPQFGIQVGFDQSGAPDLSLQLTVSPAGTTVTLSPDVDYSTVTNAAGKVFTATVETAAGERFEYRFRLSGTPVGNDTLAFGNTDKGIADNRNAALLGALQTTRVLFDAGGEPTASLQSAYAQLVSSVGNKTREVQVGERAQETLLRQARDARDALSGVNLDEEAANLIRYQQAYQASGRVMAIAQRLFDELLSIAR